jgi:hypothetical protein
MEPKPVWRHQLQALQLLYLPYAKRAGRRELLREKSQLRWINFVCQLRRFNQVPVVVRYVTFSQETGIDVLRAAAATGSITAGETPSGHSLAVSCVLYVTFRHERAAVGPATPPPSTGATHPIPVKHSAPAANGSITAGETPSGHRLYPVCYMSHSVTKPELTGCVQLRRPGPLQQVRHPQGIHWRYPVWYLSHSVLTPSRSRKRRCRRAHEVGIYRT